ncbi:hypothetical protein NDU88_005415 [Pleurodeles waltl]|uniref:Uncharacterized protein n=1 Tax=Pleurodeles waltl TaxID=8319 RepID=A0AAV7NWL2_PLEWA|nr:hypothetical protein NDU88_005415 [Pleurodeles waltl]
MGRHKRTDASQGNTMEQYTTLVPLPQCPVRSVGSGDGFSVAANPEEPSLVELIAAIQGSRVSLEGNAETVAVEVDLLWADLRKVSDKVKVAESSIVELQTEPRATAPKAWHRQYAGAQWAQQAPGPILQQQRQCGRPCGWAQCFGRQQREWRSLLGSGVSMSIVWGPFRARQADRMPQWYVQ